MANREREPQLNKHTGLRIGLAVTTIGFLGAAGAVATGRTFLGELSRQRVSASEKQEGGIMPSEKAFNELVTVVTETPFPTLVASPTAESAPTGIPPTNTPEQLSPTATPPTKTPEPTPTAASTPTQEPSPTSSPTATREATPTPKPENPLPRYGVFFGNVTDPKTGAKVAEMVMASIPQEGSLDEIFEYWITSRDEGGFRTHSGGQDKPRNIKGSHFEIGGTITIWVKADYNEKEKTIEGITYYIDGKNGSKFKLKLVGEGKEAILKAMRQIISNQSSDQPTTPERELSSLKIKTGLWP